MGAILVLPALMTMLPSLTLMTLIPCTGPTIKSIQPFPSMLWVSRAARHDRLVDREVQEVNSPVFTSCFPPEGGAR